ncbi:MAG: type I glyceraldehyde-3-phosphate dehydrogenase [Proteobacteria bacterium]|nr:type I glyceraldehyde-3-phosphate dehydrogenase [Pseudomonadota bacterium]
MKAKRIAINGFGRIGRSIVRAFMARDGMEDIEVVAINLGMGSADVHLHLLKHDSTYGSLELDVADGTLNLGKGKITLLQETEIERLDWGRYGVDMVLECTGVFSKRAQSIKHISHAGASQVLISSPSLDADAMVVYGVNTSELKAEYKVISAGSCTTNCLAPIAMVLDQEFGIKSGFMTTIHAYTNDQKVLDSIHSDKRRARACAQSMIPASTGAAKSLGMVLPQLAGKLDGVAVRVPVPNVSMVDLVVTLDKMVNKEMVHDAMVAHSASGSLYGVMQVSFEELVSVDYNRNPHSAIFDATQTKILEDGHMLRVAAWYDNEWGFANRMLDIARAW